MSLAEKIHSPVHFSIFRSVLMGAILLSTLGLFSQTLNYDFINWDDRSYISTNPIIKTLNKENLLKIATTVKQSPLWHPVTWLTHSMDYHLYHLNPWGHHLTNVIFHALNSLCLFFLFVLLIKLAAPEELDLVPVYLAGFFTALLFGLHPLRVESVAWISERKGLLSTFFGLLTLIAYLYYGSARNLKSRRGWFLAALGLFALAIMSKPSIMVIPAIFLLLDFYPLNRLTGTGKDVSIYLEKIPFLLLGGFAGAMAAFGQFSRGTLTTLADLDIHDRLITVARGMYFYFHKTLFPFQLVPFYPLSFNLSFLSAPVIIPVLILLGITFYVLWSLKNKNYFWFVAWFFYLLSILPVSGLVHFSWHMAADRYSYFSTLSFYILAGIGFMWVWNRAASMKFGQTKLLAVSFGLVVIFGCLTHHQLKIWSQSQVFWEYIERNYSTPLTHNNLGTVYRGKGMVLQAENQYKQAIRMDPKNPDPFVNLGVLYAMTDKMEKAKTMLQKGLNFQFHNSIAHGTLGVVLAKQGFLKKAETEFKLALELNPDYVEAYYNLGTLYKEKGLLKRAEKELEKAYLIDPDFELALQALVQLYQTKTLGKIN